MPSASPAAAQLPVPGTPPAAHSPGQRGSWDPGWPPASAQSPAPAGKRSRLGTPIPGVAIGPEELHRTITTLIEWANDHATRIDALERESGKPVVTSNQAAMWGTLRKIGDKRAVPGAGRLFRDA